MPRLQQSAVIVALWLQGRKRRWSDGARLVARARVEHARGPVAPPRSLRKHLRLSTDASAGFAVHTFAALTPSASAPTILYLHGGGYVRDFAAQHWSYLRAIVEACGATVVAPQYPLAPEHTWRDSFDQVVALGRDVDVIMGDSAGGGYALAVAQRLAAEGIRRSTALIAPALDMTMSSPHTAAYDARDPWLAADGLLHCGRAWAGDDDPARAEISPLFGELEGLGRLIVFTGTRDVLHPQAMDLAERLPGVVLVVEPGCVHNYPLLPIPEARAALRTLRRFLRGDPLPSEEGSPLD